LEERKAVAEIGAGIVAAGRGDVLQMDHYVLSKDEAALAGVPVVLTVCDVVTRYTEFEAADTQTAGETARACYTRAGSGTNRALAWLSLMVTRILWVK
jgi:hypothetical protein